MNQTVVDTMRAYYKKRSIRIDGSCRRASVTPWHIKRDLGLDYSEYASEWHQAMLEVRLESARGARGDYDEICLAVLRYQVQHASEDFRRYGWKSVPRDKWEEVEKQCAANAKSRRSYHGEVSLWG